MSGAGCTTYGIDGVTYMLVAGGTEAKSGSSTKAFLIWLDALAYGVSFPLPDLVHPRPHSPSAAVDGLYGHIMGGTGEYQN